MTFLQKAKEVQAAIVYITMGSLANLNKCEVKALYEGAGAATADGKPCYVIWSLRGKSRKLLHEVIQEQKPPVPSTEEQTEIGRFFIKGWLPQIDILNYEDVKAMIEQAWPLFRHALHPYALHAHHAPHVHRVHIVSHA